MSSHPSRESRSGGGDEAAAAQPADVAEGPDPRTPAAAPAHPHDHPPPPAAADRAAGTETSPPAVPDPAPDRRHCHHDDDSNDTGDADDGFAADDLPDDSDPAASGAAKADRWDADDPRRQHDQFAPPTEPCECHCLHCGRTFSSEGIWFQRVINDPQGFEGFWMCPTPNCSGAGFTFDLFPTDPAHPANEGWHDDDDDDEVPEGFEDGDEDDALNDPDAAVADADTGGPSFDDHLPPFGDDGDLFGPPAGDADADEYDPAEPRYKELDELYGDEDDDDLEGEEWKYGLQPGERPANPAAEQARREWEAEQRRYDEPDQRPRVLDWSDREDRREDRRPGSGGDGPYPDMPYPDGQFKDDDIPF